jgi:hypothetical protein
MSQIPLINPLSIARFSGDPGAGFEVGEAERNAVESLIFSYSYNWDSREVIGTASLFTEDADVAFFFERHRRSMECRTVGWSWRGH